MKLSFALIIRKLFFTVFALYVGYCALCWLIPSARLGNVTPAGLNFTIFFTNLVGCFALAVVNLMEFAVLGLGFIFGLGMVLHSRARDYRKGGRLEELGELKLAETVVELLVAVFIIYLFYMEFVEQPEPVMPPVWERIWQGIKGCIPK